MLIKFTLINSIAADLMSSTDFWHIVGWLCHMNLWLSVPVTHYYIPIINFLDIFVELNRSFFTEQF